MIKTALQKIFKIEEHGTNIKTEILAGITTFFTMSYIFVLCPKLMESVGFNIESSLFALVVSVFAGCCFSAFIANKPFAIAPFLGEIAFIAYSLVSWQGIAIEKILAAISVCGVIFLIMTICGLRLYIIKKIPDSIKSSFCCGLGLFFIFISMKSMGIVKYLQGELPPSNGDLSSLHVILSIFCFIIICVFSQKKNNAAILIAIFSVSLIGILLNDIKLPSMLISLPQDAFSTFVRTDFSGIFNIDFIPIFFVLFMLINIDTAGSCTGLLYRTDEKYKTDADIKKVMLADSLAIMTVPLTGMTTPGTYADSVTGMEAGGKTGLTSFTVGALFLLGLFISPLIKIIPAYAYAPALLYVGILLSGAIRDVKFDDTTEYIPFIFAAGAMVFTYNPGIGIMFAFVLYPLLKLLAGRKEETNKVQWVLFILSVIFFAVYPY